MTNSFRTSELGIDIMNDICDWCKKSNNTIQVWCSCGYKEYANNHEIIDFCSNCRYTVITFISTGKKHLIALLDITNNELKHISILYSSQEEHIISIKNKSVYIKRLWTYGYGEKAPTIKIKNVYKLNDIYYKSSSSVTTNYADNIQVPNHGHLPLLSSFQRLLDDINPNKEPVDIIIEI